MPRKWFGDDHVGNDQATLATDWVSVTIGRPVARLAMNGKRPFRVLRLGWKCCAAPSLGQKMYARISNPDGTVFDNSYIGNTISWQKEAKTIYEFQAINMHFDDDGGAKLRAWLVSGGPFYFSRATGGGGSIQSAKGQFGGTAVGYADYTQVALPPTGLKVARDEAEPNKVTFAWNEWDLKKNASECGDSTSLMGYCVQVARDAAFTKNVRLLYVSKGKGEAYGLYTGYDWYFRIATRNEVSEKYKLPGGIWSDSVLLPATTVVTPTPSAGAGVGSGAVDAGSGTDTGSSGGLSGNNPNAGSNAGGASPTTSTPTVVTTTETVVNTVVKQGKESAAVRAPALAEAADAAHASPTAASWTVVVQQLAALSAVVTSMRASVPATLTARYAALAARIDQVKALAQIAVTTAGGSQTLAMRLSSALIEVMRAHDEVYDAVVVAKDRVTVSTWRAVGLHLDDLAFDVNTLVALTSDETKVAWQTALVRTNEASAATNAAQLKLTAPLVETARARALAAREAVRAARAITAAPSTDYSAAEDGVREVAATLVALLNDTPESSKVTKTVTIGGGKTIPSNSAGSTTDGAAAGGSTPTTTPTTDGGTQVVYTPIPDTTATRTRFGGLLISQLAPRSPGHTVYLNDRGGRQRIGELKSPTFTRYNRIRDDQSLATVQISGTAIEANAALLEQLAVGRHELCIFRGRERVWEGPITLAQWKKDSVELRAHDVTHYLNRTVMKSAYSNAYPALDFVVARIAGIIANELGVKEALDPPINVLPYMRTYVQEGDARTSRTTFAAEATVWQHLDDLAAKAGLDYTVIGRALHIWDTSRPALGRLRKLTEADFLGEVYIAAYGMEVATQTFVSDGQGNFGRAGGIDDFYGEIDLLAQAYDENGNAVDQQDLDPSNDTIPIAEMEDQATRNLKGRNPTPLGLKIPDGSALRTDRGINLDVLIPGVIIPVSATLAGRTIDQNMKLKEVRVEQTADGEAVAVVLTPASESDEEATLEVS